MKLIWFIITFSCFISFSVHSGSHFVSGEIEYVRTHDGDAHPTWRPPRFWFTLKGVTKAGSCPTWYSDTVLFVSKDTAAYSLILSAYMAGKPVAVAYDDSLIFGNHWCMARYITLGDPPPLK